MKVPGTVGSARRTASLLTVGAVIALIIGILSMHVINPITVCALPSSEAMTPAHAAPTAAASAVGHSQDPHSIDVAHAPNQCTAAPVRKALLEPAGAAARGVAIVAIAVVSLGLLRRRRDRPLVPDPLSIAGGLRR